MAFRRQNNHLVLDVPDVHQLFMQFSFRIPQGLTAQSFHAVARGEDGVEECKPCLSNIYSLSNRCLPH